LRNADAAAVPANDVPAAVVIAHFAARGMSGAAIASFFANGHGAGGSLWD
jgi:hypothetical protein